MRTALDEIRFNQRRRAREGRRRARKIRDALLTVVAAVIFLLSFAAICNWLRACLELFGFKF